VKELSEASQKLKSDIVVLGQQYAQDRTIVSVSNSSLEDMYNLEQYVRVHDVIRTISADTLWGLKRLLDALSVDNFGHAPSN